MKNNLATYFSAIVISLLLITAQSCYDPPVQLGRGNRVLADSIFRAQEVILKKEIDSLCKLDYQEIFDLAVDSISAVRLQEIENINN